MPRGRKLGTEVDCGSWLRRVTQDWLDGMGPGGKREAFPSSHRRVAAGEVILRMVEGCSEAGDLKSKVEAELKREIRKAKGRS